MKKTLVIAKEDKKSSQLKKEYEVLKFQFEKQIASETLKKYLILSKAYKIGKILNGFKFTRQTLAKDFQIPYSTAKRLLSLDKMTPKTKRLLHSGKISAFKVAQITSTKSHLFQDEIVDLVVSKELNSQDIKKLKPENVKDINEYKFNKAIEKGYSRKDSLYLNFQNTANRLNSFLTLNIDSFPDTKKFEVLAKLREIKKQIDFFLEKNSIVIT